MKISVVGTGYVGVSIATLLAQKHKAIALDVIKEKVDMINQKIFLIKDNGIEEYLKYKELDLLATLDTQKAIEHGEYTVISTPTNYDEKKNYFDTSTV